MYDTIIIGGGPAGVSAAIYAARKKLKTLLITSEIGGQILETWEIENYPGLPEETGATLAQKFEQHLNKFAVKIKKEEVKAIEQKKDSFAVQSEKETFQSQTLILAMGKKPRELGIPGEHTYKGKGVSYCATCDGPLFTNKDVVIVGGGNAGLETAIQMDKIARKVYLVEKGALCAGDPLLLERVQVSAKTTILTHAEIAEIYGQALVSGVKIKNNQTQKIHDYPIQGIFVEIGSIPNTQLVQKLVTLDQNQKIKIDRFCQTSIPGIFACGDVTNIPFEQIIIAAGEGAKAAISAFNFLIKN